MLPIPVLKIENTRKHMLLFASNVVQISESLATTNFLTQVRNPTAGNDCVTWRAV